MNAPEAAVVRVASRPFPRRALGNVHVQQFLLVGGLLAAWQLLTEWNVISPFFFGRPIAVASDLYNWFATGLVWVHLGTTLLETALAFLIGLGSGMAAGLWLGLNHHAADLLSPIVKAANSMPRIVLAPIFIVWFGLGIGSKVAFGVTLVFFVVFFNVFNGIREVNPTVLANARMMGANRRQLLWTVYLPSATSWVFASLHLSVGMAFVGAVVGEYLGSGRGLGYLILQAEGVFDIDSVLAGVALLTICALALDLAVSLVERRLLVWRPQ